MSNSKPNSMTFEIRSAENDDLDEIRALFTAYVASLGIDLTYQDYSSEFNSLPGKYSAPTGALLLARSKPSAQGLGCAAVRPLISAGPNCCEIKRLYVTPAGRGTGVGRALAQKAISRAREMGYDEMKLDTLSSMDVARRLYEQLGFVECEAYYDTPIAGTVFMTKKLR